MESPHIDAACPTVSQYSTGFHVIGIQQKSTQEVQYLTNVPLAFHMIGVQHQSRAAVIHNPRPVPPLLMAECPVRQHRYGQLANPFKRAKWSISDIM